jgi:hypothetical protein
MSNNWHRIIWDLSKPNPEHDPENFFLDNFYHETNSNRFWLEPEAYMGPTVTIGKDIGEVKGRMEFPTNSLCFRIRFAEGEMRAPWKNCVVFPHGSEPLQFQDGTPNFTFATEELAGRTKVEGHDTVLIFGMDPNDPTILHIRAEKEGVGNHLGMGVAHQ